MSVSAEQKHDFLFKFIIIGDSGAGKSALLRYFLDKTFRPSSNHTIGVEFGSKILSLPLHRIKLQIWDTAGQERFRSVCKSYYRGALGCLLVYDVNSRDSYNSLTAWLKDARELARPDITVCVVGNQIDRGEREREVPALEAGRFAQENDCLFMEASAATGLNVDSIFEVVCGRIVSKIVSGSIDEKSMMKDVHPGVATPVVAPEEVSSCGKC